LEEKKSGIADGKKAIEGNPVLKRWVFLESCNRGGHAVKKKNRGELNCNRRQTKL